MVVVRRKYADDPEAEMREVGSEQDRSPQVCPELRGVSPGTVEAGGVKPTINAMGSVGGSEYRMAQISAMYSPWSTGMYNHRAGLATLFNS